MLFQTWEFVIFFAVVMAGMALLRPGLKSLWLLAASYFFYGYMSPACLVFIIYITIVDYFIGRGLAAYSSNGVRKTLVTLSIINGVMLLSLFKYADFITVNLQALCDCIHWQVHVPTIAESAQNIFNAFNIDYALPAQILLPAGISFFTFKSLSYTIDVYRHDQRVERNFIHYASYLAFFPALLSGPIDRSGLLIKQLRHKMPFRPVDFSDGVCLFISGMFKKVVLADTLAVFVNQVYNAEPGSYGALAVVLATYAYAWQLYGDFAGYTDMARGIAKIMGIHLTLNFNNPYVAVDFSDFWRRWHISLSSWFRDYVYIPLGGSRVVRYRIWWNLFLTMLVSGFWHGSAWTFIIWGAWHGILAVIWRGFEKREWYVKLPKLLKQLVVFNLVAVGWVFFRAQTFEQAVGLLKVVFSGAAGAVSAGIPWLMLGMAAAVWIYQLVFDSRFNKVLAWAPLRYIIFAIVVALILIVPADANQKFLYFDF